MTTQPEPKYLTEARTAFVAEFTPLSPAEVVSTGLKPISEWCACLKAARTKYPHQTAEGARAINVYKSRVHAQNTREP